LRLLDKFRARFVITGSGTNENSERSFGHTVTQRSEIMATPDRDTVYTNDGNRTVYTRESSGTGWFVGIIVALALLAIGYLVFSANSGTSTTSVDVNGAPVTSTEAPADPAIAPAPMTEAPAATPDAAPMTQAPATDTAPAADATAPATDAAPAADTTAPANTTAPATGG
jgi:hypothetical protein